MGNYYLHRKLLFTQARHWRQPGLIRMARIQIVTKGVLGVKTAMQLISLKEQEEEEAI